MRPKLKIRSILKGNEGPGEMKRYKSVGQFFNHQPLRMECKQLVRVVSKIQKRIYYLKLKETFH